VLAFGGFAGLCCHARLVGRIYQAGEEGNGKFMGGAVQGWGTLFCWRLWI
jgi:hypothetical protein